VESQGLLPEGAQGFVDTIPDTNALSEAGSDGDRGGRRRRRRGGRDRGEGRDDAAQGNLPIDGEPSADASAESGDESGNTPETAASSESQEAPAREGGRRRRGRGRRDDREGTTQDGMSGDAAPAEGRDEQDLTEVAAAPAAPAASVSATVSVAESLDASTSAAAAATVEVVAAMPEPQVYALPVRDLEQLAGTSGLVWVHSDADKVRAVQAAIAAEPAPQRVAREPRRIVLPDDGPLVLVETRKDLSQLKLPFETSTTV
jgi:ribonuclease E